MTVSLAIAIIVIADIAIVATLAFVMSRASKLRPHVSAASAPAPATVPPVQRTAARRPQGAGARLAPVAS